MSETATGEALLASACATSARARQRRAWPVNPKRAGAVVIVVVAGYDTADMEPTPPPSPTGEPQPGPVRPTWFAEPFRQLAFGRKMENTWRLVLWALSAWALCALGGLGVLITPLLGMGSDHCSGQDGCDEAWILIMLSWLVLLVTFTAGGLVLQWLLARRWALRPALRWEPLAIVTLSAAPVMAFEVLKVVGVLIERIFGVA